jgi:hypothetical protein
MESVRMREVRRRFLQVCLKTQESKKHSSRSDLTVELDVRSFAS